MATKRISHDDQSVNDYVQRGRLMRRTAIADLQLLLDDAVRQWDADPTARRMSQLTVDIFAEYALRDREPNLQNVKTEVERLSLAGLARSELLWSKIQARTTRPVPGPR